MSSSYLETSFERRAQALFDRSVEQLDARTRSRLTQARSAAVEEAHKHAGLRRWVFRPAGALAAASLAALALVLWRAQEPQPLVTSADELEVVVGAESFEMLENVEFYAWLDQR
ncbi:MAG TPA: hypothetical protein VF161_06190 [Steroidobacteraceae bacterium]